MTVLLRMTIKGLTRLSIFFCSLKAPSGSERPPYLNVHVELPLLETLRVNYHNGLIVQRLLSTWVLPSLKTLILDNPVIHAVLEDFWSMAGKALTRVEIGPGIQFRNHDYLSFCIKNCPVLEDLGFYVWALQNPRRRRGHPTLQRVRIHLGQWAEYDLMDDSLLDTLLHDHLVKFNHSGMQSLTTFDIRGSEHLGVYTGGFDWGGIEKQIVAEGREIVLHR